jgi:hypothetical protein
MGYIRNMIMGKLLLSRSRVNEKAFTRNRKVGFATLVCMILNMIRKSSQLEIDDFVKKFGTYDRFHVHQAIIFRGKTEIVS